MGDLASPSKTSQSTATTVNTSDSRIAVADAGQLVNIKGNTRDFSYINTSSDPELIQNVLLGGGALIGQIVKGAQDSQSQQLALTAGALNASSEREAAIQADRINPDASSQKNILIAVGIGGAVLLFSALGRK